MKTLNDQVREFHVAAEIPVAEIPRIPSDDRIRLRLKLITEEYIELLAATLAFPDVTPDHLPTCIMDMLNSFITNYPLSVNLPELADAMADLDYVVEGTRLEFGIDGKQVADEVHRANMSKFTCTCSDPFCCEACNGTGHTVYKREDGKILKSPRWSPPDIASILSMQGEGR